MILHVGERVSWGAPEVIYLEGTISKLDPASQSVQLQIDRTTPNSAHLIGSELTFFADGLTPLKGETPPGTTSTHDAHPQPLPHMDDAEKIRRAAAAAVHQERGYTLPAEQERTLIEQVAQAINADPAMRTHIIASMDAILNRTFG